MRRAMLGSILALALLGLVLAGCGGSSGGSSEATSTTASAGGETAKSGEGAPGFTNISAEARTCLKEKGVELPELKAGAGAPGGEGGEPPEGFEPPEGGELPEGGPPAGGVGGKSSKKMQKAFKECGVEAPEFKAGAGAKGAPKANLAAFKKQVKEYVACVRENGYELAEPNFSGEGPIFEKAESESTAFKQASKQCQSLLGGPGGSQSG